MRGVASMVETCRYAAKLANNLRTDPGYLTYPVAATPSNCEYRETWIWVWM
jgi:hypothetical protein